ncbi:MAG: restriction endonuclease subunit S [Candidatus Pacearchaeota archaeon]
MSSSWPRKKLVEVCEKVKIEKAPVSIMPYIEIGDIDVETKMIKYKEKGAVKGSIFAPANCLIVSRVRPTRGAVALINKKIAVSSAFTILKPKPFLNLKFLFYCLAYNSKFFEYLGLRQKGSNYPSCREKDIFNFEIPLPPLEIQKRIVARIEELFAKIDKAKELREKAKEETEQIFPSVLQEVFIKNKKKWGVKNLGEICEKIKQTHPKNIFKSEFSYIDITSIDPVSKSIISIKKIPVNEAPHRARKLVKEGDTIFATTRPYLKNIAYISKDYDNCIVSTGFCVIRPKKEIADPLYIFFVVNSDSFVSQILPFQRGASYPAVSDSDVYNSEIPLPPLSEQKKIVDYLDNLREKIEKLKKLQEEQLKDLEELKKSILEKAFAGELI